MTRADEFYDLMVEAVPGECIRWGGAHVGNGYGQVHWNGRGEYVHVIACEYRHGPKPAGRRYEASHSCRHPDCFNPWCLSWKTVPGNQADRLRDDTHQYGERSTFAKLTQVQVDEIRARWIGPGGRLGKGRPTQQQLADEYSVHVNTISRIVRDRTFAVGL